MMMLGPGEISLSFRPWAMGLGRGLGLGRAWAGPGLLLGWRPLGLGGAGPAWAEAVFEM